MLRSGRNQFQKTLSELPPYIIAMEACGSPATDSTGGKDRLGRITKMGQRDVRKLLIIGAMSVISASERKGHCEDPWLARMLEKRPRMVVAAALANRMARRLWAMMAKGRDYEIQVAA